MRNIDGHNLRRFFSLLLIFAMLFSQMGFDTLVSAVALAEPEATEIPTEAPTQEPSPTEAPKQEPTQAPSPTPTEVPPETPTATPPETPTATPPETPTPTPTEVPPEIPTPTATEVPPETPTATPPETPTPSPVPPETPTPSPIPSETPTESPTEEPAESDLMLFAGFDMLGAGDDKRSAYDATIQRVLDNPTSTNPVVYFDYAAIAGADEVLTGDFFTYEIGYNLGPASQYVNNEGLSVLSYTQYKNVTVTFKVPEGLEIYLLTPGGAIQGSPIGEGQTATIALGNIDAGPSGSFSVKGKMTGNGTLPDGTVFPKLDLHIEATVTVTDTEGKAYDLVFKRDLTHEASENQTAVTSIADTEWDVIKTAGETVVEGAAGAGKVQFTYYRGRQGDRRRIHRRPERLPEARRAQLRRGRL